MTVLVARPRSVGSWTFVIRDASEHAETVSAIKLEGVRDSGTIRVGDIPFEIERTKMNGPYTLRFEGQPLAQAKPTGTLSTAYQVIVEGAVFAQDVALGDRLTFDFAPPSLISSSYELRLEGEKWGEIVRESSLFRHYVLRFREGIPLAIGTFCFALVLARLRRQSRG